MRHPNNWQSIKGSSRFASEEFKKKKKKSLEYESHQAYMLFFFIEIKCYTPFEFTLK